MHVEKAPMLFGRYGRPHDRYAWLPQGLTFGAWCFWFFGGEGLWGRRMVGMKKGIRRSPQRDGEISGNRC